MKKHVPDPPFFNLGETAETTFGGCESHPPLFSVRAGVSAEDALVHAALYLKCATGTCLQAVDYTRECGRGFTWSTLHSLQIAEGLINALLDGIECRQMKEESLKNSE